MLRPQRGDLLFKPWRREAIRAVRAARLGPVLPFLLSLTPTVGYFPDFLNPVDSLRGLDHGLEAIRSTPGHRLSADLTLLGADTRLPGQAQQLAAGEPAMLVSLTDAMARAFHCLVEPHRPVIDHAVGRDRQVRTHALATDGVEGLFRSFRPMMSWSSGELSIPSHRDQELHLGGRGILLIPAYFCVNGPMTMWEPGLPPVLVYPVDLESTALPATDHLPNLAALMGTTRAAALDALSLGPLTTTALARALNCSPASASQHLTVLRQARLTTSHRDRNRMFHQLTDLGIALLGDQRYP